GSHAGNAGTRGAARSPRWSICWDASRISAARGSPGSLRHARRPAYDAILQLFVSDFVLAGTDAAAHRNPGLVHRFRIAGNQRMPPVKIAPFGEQAIRAGRRQPDNAPDIARGEPDAVLHLRGTIGIIATAAACPIEQPAANTREIGPAWIVGILELDQAAAAAAVAEALPFRIRHFRQRFTSPKRQLLGSHIDKSLGLRRR